MAVIERDGEAAVRVREVAAAAGVTYSAVQFHFGGRDGLLDAAYLDLYRRDLLFPVADLRRRAEASGGSDGFRQVMLGLLDAAFSDDRVSARRRRAQVLGAAATRPAIAAGLATVHREYFAALAAVFDEPHRRGWLRSDLEVEAMGAVYLAIVNGRALIEMGDTGLDLAAWDAAAAAAVLAFVDPLSPPSAL